MHPLFPFCYSFFLTRVVIKIIDLLMLSPVEPLCQVVFVFFHHAIPFIPNRSWRRNVSHSGISFFFIYFFCHIFFTNLTAFHHCLCVTLTLLSLMLLLIEEFVNPEFYILDMCLLNHVLKNVSCPLCEIPGVPTSHSAFLFKICPHMI